MKILFWIIVVLVVVVGGWFAWMHFSGTNQNQLPVTIPTEQTQPSQTQPQPSQQTSSDTGQVPDCPQYFADVNTSDVTAILGPVTALPSTDLSNPMRNCLVVEWVGSDGTLGSGGTIAFNNTTNLKDYTSQGLDQQGYTYGFVKNGVSVKAMISSDTKTFTSDKMIHVLQAIENKL